MVRVKSPQDLGAGLLFLAISGAGLWFGRDLEFGTARAMGPGYFPLIISACIGVLGAVVAGRSLVVAGPEIDAFRLRPILFLVLSIAAFGLLIATVGVAISAFLLIVLAALAQPRVRPVETVVFAAAMSAFVIVVFVYALEQPMPVWWGR